MQLFVWALPAHTPSFSIHYALLCTQIHTCTLADVYACMDDAHYLHGSLLFMSSPNALILGLPGTAMINSQTVIKESLVDVFSRCA